MATILYIETNFPLAVAKGQDPDANVLLDERPTGLAIVMPSACYMEALSTLNEEKKHRNRFILQVDAQIREVRRNTWPQAARLLPYLEQVRVESENLLNDFEDRLRDALDRIRRLVETIEPASEILQEALTNAAISDPTDALILECVLAHARVNSGPKAFLSGNKNDFDQPGVRQRLEAAGILKFFSRCGDARGWISWIASAPPT